MQPVVSFGRVFFGLWNRFFLCALPGSPRPPCTMQKYPFAVPQGRVFAGCKAMVRSVYDALQRGADNQVSGVLGTLQGAVAQINTPEMMWVFSRPGCPLDVNNPDHPAILTVATNPTTSQTLSPLCSLVITVATKLMNQCLGKKKKNVVLWRDVRFVILLPGFVRMVGDPPRSAGHAISFCNNRLAVFMV